jgi:hypothetical protein
MKRLLHIREEDPPPFFLSHSAWRLPVNMNIEEGESKKQLYRSENYLSSSLKCLQILERKFQSGLMTEVQNVL